MKLPQLRFYLTSMPKLVEHIEIAPGDRRLIRIGHPVPAFGARAVHERVLVGDAERLGVIAVLRLDVAKLDVAVQPAPHGHEPVAVLHGANGVSDQNANTGKRARKDETLQRLEEI